MAAYGGNRFWREFTGQGTASDHESSSAIAESVHRSRQASWRSFPLPSADTPDALDFASWIMLEHPICLYCWLGGARDAQPDHDDWRQCPQIQRHDVAGIDDDITRISNALHGYLKDARTINHLHRSCLQPHPLHQGTGDSYSFNNESPLPRGLCGRHNTVVEIFTVAMRHRRSADCLRQRFPKLQDMSAAAMPRFMLTVEPWEGEKWRRKIDLTVICRIVHFTVRLAALAQCP